MQGYPRSGRGSCGAQGCRFDGLGIPHRLKPEARFVERTILAFVQPAPSRPLPVRVRIGSNGSVVSREFTCPTMRRRLTWCNETDINMKSSSLICLLVRVSVQSRRSFRLVPAFAIKRFCRAGLPVHISLQFQALQDEEPPLPSWAVCLGNSRPRR
jgi:hypothetical protein